MEYLATVMLSLLVKLFPLPARLWLDWMDSLSNSDEV